MDQSLDFEPSRPQLLLALEKGVVPPWTKEFLEKKRRNDVREKIFNQVSRRAAKTAETMRIDGAYRDAEEFLDKARAALGSPRRLEIASGQMLLLQGNYQEGLKLAGQPLEGVARNRPWLNAMAQWQGQKTTEPVLVWSWITPGIGAEVLRLAVLDLLLERCPNVGLACDARLHLALRRKYPTISLFGHEGPGDDAVRFKFEVSILALPGLVWRAPVRDEGTYLAPDRNEVDRFREQYRAFGKHLVGLSWFTPNPNLGDQRSVPPEVLAGLVARHPDVTFVSLQHDLHKVGLPQVDGHPVFVDPKVDPRDLEKIFAQMAALDAIVTIDNSVSHFSGAMGLKVVVLLSTVPRPFWTAAGNHTPFYPTAVLARQERPRDWNEPLSKASAFLTEALSARQD